MSEEEVVWLQYLGAALHGLTDGPGFDFYSFYSNEQRTPSTEPSTPKMCFGGKVSWFRFGRKIGDVATSSTSTIAYHVVSFDVYSMYVPSNHT